MKKTIGHVLWVFLGVMLLLQPVAWASANSALIPQRPKPAKSSKGYLKREKRAEKKAQRSQKKTVNHWKKQHKTHD